MFVKLVQNLAFVPGLGPQLTFYVRRLRKEELTRKLSVFAGLGLMAFQVAAFVAPPIPSNAASSNDIIFGGVKDKAALLRVYDHGLPGHHTGQDIRDIFNYFKITRTDLNNMTSGTTDSRESKGLWSMGRNHVFAQDAPVKIGGTTFYLRPLHLWDKVNPYNIYPSLVGKRSADGTSFNIILGCGNLVFKGIPPAVSKPKPPGTPPSTPIPPSPPPVVEPKEPNIEKAKQAIFVATGNNADGQTAKAGDVIEYTLIVTNTGNGAKSNYVVRENVRDILEYASIINKGNAKLSNGVLTWPAQTIGAGKIVAKKFEIKVNSPISARPRSSSDPTSFDLRMDNVYGNAVTIDLPPPPAKQIELASAQLPRTGIGLNATLVFVFVGLCVYFYSRNRQLITEVNILRAEQAHGGGNHI